MKELYKGQISFTEMKTIPHRDLLDMRNTRLARLQKEREEIEAERKAEADKQAAKEAQQNRRMRSR